MVKYINDRNTPIYDLEGDANIESDCEDDSAGASDEMLEKEESRAILIVGSFSAYVRLPPLTPGEMTSSPAGNPFSSIAAQTRSCLLPSNRKVSTFV